jgi:hypothetical protein
MNTQLTRSKKMTVPDWVIWCDMIRGMYANYPAELSKFEASLAIYKPPPKERQPASFKAKRRVLETTEECTIDGYLVGTIERMSK